MLLMRDHWEELIMRGTILSAVLFAATLGGCYTTGTVGYSPGYYANSSTEVYVSSPDLVEVSPGVQVVADYDEPVFYTDGFYWRYSNDGWYRSNNYSNGWYYYERPPVAVLQINRPYAYAHYRPQGYVARSRGRYRPAEPISRDRREPAYRADPGRRESGYRPDPVVRDHRDAGPPSRPPTYPSDTVVRDHRDAGPPSRPPTPAPEPVVREHRDAGPPSRSPTPAPAPVVRDHRAAPPAAREDNTRTRDHRH
jgi:hypothetical protein